MLDIFLTILKSLSKRTFSDNLLGRYYTRISGRKDIPEVYGLGKAILFDEFFYCLDHFGFKDLFAGLDPKTKKRESPRCFYCHKFFKLRYALDGSEK